MSRSAARAPAPKREDTLHRIYVHKVPPGYTSHNKSRDLTRQILEYVKANLKTIRQMGIKIKIIPLTSKALSHRKIKQHLVSVLSYTDPVTGEVVTPKLPAVRTPTRPYCGIGDIIALYDGNIQEYRAFKRQGNIGPSGAIHDEDTDALAKFYSEEMTFDRAKSDRGREEEGLGEEKDIMTAYREQLKMRMGGGKAKTKPKIRPRPKKASGGSRRDNLPAAPAGDPLAALDALGVDPDDPAGSAADDHMMRTFLENMEETVM